MVTTLLTRVGDPQRGFQRWEPRVDVFRALTQSLGVDTLVVLHDAPLVGSTPHAVQPVRVITSDVNPYFQRWFSIAEYLRDAEWDRVWCVDASDVTMLRKPWDHMEPGRLYAGHEPAEIGVGWMRAHHRSRLMAKFIHTNSSKRVLNAGVLGGDRGDVARFAQDIRDLWDDNLRLQAAGLERQNLGVGDMAAFNYVAYTLWEGRVEWGSQVTTDFKSYEDNGLAWWMHK